MLADAIKQAQRLHREVVEATYDGTCSIYEQKPIKDPVTKVTKLQEVMVVEKILCHLSFSRTATATDAGMMAAVSQSIKLFLSPDIDVKPGSRIDVTQQGRTESYCKSGKAAAYSSHQEVLLELWRGYA